MDPAIKGVKNIEFFAKGKRGYIYTGMLGRTKVAIKKESPSTRSPGTIRNEAEKLRILNKHGIGPKLLKKGKDYIVYRFIKGIPIRDFMGNGKTSKSQLKKVLMDALRKCFAMDKLGLNKEEMTNPYKHIIVDASGKSKANPKVQLIDFERCRKTLKPGNVTQFSQYIMSNKQLLDRKGFRIDKAKIIEACKEYRKKMSKHNFEGIARKIG